MRANTQPGQLHSRTLPTLTVTTTNVDSSPAWVHGLLEKTSRHGQWSPTEINLQADIQLWRELSEPQRAVLRRVLSRFVHGEGQVRDTLDPLVARRLREGRLKEAEYVRIFQAEEAKHTEFFKRYFDEVIGVAPLGVADIYSKPFRRLFNEILERELAGLIKKDWRAEVRALTTYMLVCEGTIAETAYYGFRKALVVGQQKLLPGLLEGLDNIQRDEARHVGYGVQALRRCADERGGCRVGIEVSLQLLRVAPSAYGCVGMVHNEFKPFPFPHLDRTALKKYAREKFVNRARTILGRRRGSHL